MKRGIVALCLLAFCACPNAKAEAWQPAAGHVQMPIWPDAAPGAKPLRGPETMRPSDKDVGGRRWMAVTDVSRPTLTVYAPKENTSGAAVVVFPGGGFEVLAIDLEGTEICDWLTSAGVTCVLLKYRVPSEPYDWHCDCRAHNYMTPKQALQDAQRAMGLVRQHAAEWHIDPHKVGVLGFSAGGYLVAAISTKFAHRLYAPIDEADKQSARPDFAVAIYPGHLATDGGTLNPNVAVTRETPPTFLLQAQDDHVDGVNQALVYHAALLRAGVPVEMHVYAQGGHAFGLRPTPYPVSGWPRLVEAWMGSIGMLAR